MRHEDDDRDDAHLAAHDGAGDPQQRLLDHRAEARLRDQRDGHHRGSDAGPVERLDQQEGECSGNAALHGVAKRGDVASRERRCEKERPRPRVGRRRGQEPLCAVAELARVEGTNARRRAAEAKACDAELDVGYCSVRAPFGDYVTNLNIAVGQYANAGREVIALVDDRTWHVLANFKETYLEGIAPGARAEVFLLAYPGRPFSGVVQGIGWALHQENGASVGVLPQTDPTLNWVRLAQRFPVRIVLDPPDPQHPYRMGATAIVTLRGGRGGPASNPAPDARSDASGSSGSR